MDGGREHERAAVRKCDAGRRAVHAPGVWMDGAFAVVPGLLFCCDAGARGVLKLPATARHTHTAY